MKNKFLLVFTMIFFTHNLFTADLKNPETAVAVSLVSKRLEFAEKIKCFKDALLNSEVKVLRNFLLNEPDVEKIINGIFPMRNNLLLHDVIKRCYPCDSVLTLIENSGNLDCLDVDNQNFPGDTALHCVLDKAMEEKPNSYTAEKFNSYTPEESLSIVKSLSRKGANWLQRNRARVTPMHLAAGCGNPDIFSYMIPMVTKFSQDLNIVDYFGDTPIMYAVRRKNNEFVVEELVSLGVDCLAENIKGKTVMDEIETYEANNPGSFDYRKAVGPLVFEQAFESKNFCNTANRRIESLEKERSFSNQLNGNKFDNQTLKII